MPSRKAKTRRASSSSMAFRAKPTWTTRYWPIWTSGTCSRQTRSAEPGGNAVVHVTDNRPDQRACVNGKGRLGRSTVLRPRRQAEGINAVGRELGGPPLQLHRGLTFVADAVAQPRQRRHRIK